MLARAGARAVVFDIVFATAGPNPEADLALATAIPEHGRVVLAAEYRNTTVAPDDRNHWALLGQVEALPQPFLEAAAAWGIASQGVDDDFVVRLYVAGFTGAGQPSLTWAAAGALALPATTNAAALTNANQHWVRYYGPALTMPHLSFAAALDPAGVPDAALRDKIILIGGRPLVGRLNERKDEFRNPFHSWQYRDYCMPGVEVHATELLNLVRGDWLRRLPGRTEAWLILAAG